MRRLIYIAPHAWPSLPWLVIGAVDAAGEEDRDDGYFVRAIFDNASSLVRGRGREDRRRGRRASWTRSR